MAMNAIANRGKLVDAECYLHGTPGTPVTIGARGATGVTGDGYGVATMNGDALIFDTGGGFTSMLVNIDVATTGSLATSQFWNFSYQMSDDAAMATPLVELPLLQVGSAPAAVADYFHALRTTRSTEQDGNDRDRYIIPITNDFGGTCYRYLRIAHRSKHFTAASVDIGLSYSAWLTVEP